MGRFIAIAARGTERVLEDELCELGIGATEARPGAVAFGDPMEDAYRACLWSRVASRVLLPLATFRAANAAALYDGVHAIDWTEHLQPTRTLAVDVAGKDAPAGPGHFIALKTKDAIVDRIREAKGARPSVDTANPDLRINVHVHGDRVTINLDLSGRGLHRRGIGRAGSDAPLKENLAATILRLAGWPRREHDAPFFDPMCGSGTLLIEAAWMALDVAPALMRKRIGAEGWRKHDASIWKRLRAEAEERKRASALLESLLAHAELPCLLSVSDEELELVRFAVRFRGWTLEEDHERRSSALVGDSIGLHRLSRSPGR